jgi:hypothetical protein
MSGGEGGAGSVNGSKGSVRWMANGSITRLSDAACPLSTGGGTRRVQLVREGGGGRGRDRCGPLDSFALLRRAREPRVDPAERHLPVSGRPKTQKVNGSIGRPKTQKVNGSIGRPKTQQVNGSIGRPPTQQPTNQQIKNDTRGGFCDFCAFAIFAIFAQFLIGAGRPRDRGAAGGAGARGRRTALHRTPKP